MKSKFWSGSRRAARNFAMSGPLAAGCVLFALAGPAFADFIGPLSPASWTTSNSGTLADPATQGFAAFSSTQLTLTGSDSLTSAISGCRGGSIGVAGPCQLQTTVAVGGTYSFDWSYLTTDD